MPVFLLILMVWQGDAHTLKTSEHYSAKACANAAADIQFNAGARGSIVCVDIKSGTVTYARTR